MFECLLCQAGRTLATTPAMLLGQVGQTLATTPAMLLGQAGQTPFSNYIIKLDETGVTGEIVSSCVQLLEAPSSIVLHHSGILHLALPLSVAFGLWNELFTMSIQFLKCKLWLILSEATQEVKIAISCILAHAP